VTTVHPKVSPRTRFDERWPAEEKASRTVEIKAEAEFPGEVVTTANKGRLWVNLSD
jgi:hypothetical protein